MDKPFFGFQVQQALGPRQKAQAERMVPFKGRRCHSHLAVGWGQVEGESSAGGGRGRGRGC